MKTNYCNRGKETSVYNWAQFLNIEGLLRIYNRGTEGWGWWMGTKGNIRGNGRVWLKSPDRILAECRPGGQRSRGGGGRWSCYTSRGSEEEDGGFMVSCLQKVPARIGLYKKKPSVWGNGEKRPQWAWHVGSSENLSASCLWMQK